MKSLPFRLGLCAVTATILSGAVLFSTQWGREALSGQAADGPAAKPVTMPTQLAGVLITLGLKDKEGTEWDGEVAVSAGKVLAVDIVDGNPKATVQGSKFSVRSVATPKKAAKKKGDAITRPMVRITFNAPPTAKVTVTTKQGAFDFVLGDLPHDARRLVLDGQASVEREEGAFRLTSGDMEHDYPAIAKAPDGTIWLAYSEYRKGKPYITERVLTGNFDDLVPQGNGDQVRLKRFDGKEWSAPIDVTKPGLDIWRPAVAVDKQGRAHVIWSQQLSNGRWVVFHRYYDAAAAEDKLSEPYLLQGAVDTRNSGHAVATTDSQGRVWLAWQYWEGRNNRLSIMAARVIAEKSERGFDRWSVALEEPGHSWTPAIAADSKGRVYVAYDTYANGSYDVRVVEISPQGKTTHSIASSARFEARPSIVVDPQDRVWIAYEEGDEQWGKDFSTNMFRKIGFDENPGFALYINRTIRVKCLVDGKVMQPAGDLQKAIAQRTANNRSVPRLGVDGANNIWLLYRHHPRPLGAGEVWNTFATRYDGSDWSGPRRLGQSDNLMDNRPALAPAGQGLLAVYSGDGRTKQQDRKRNDLFATMLIGSGPTQQAALVPDPPTPKAEMKPVHPNEAADVARMRAHRFDHQGKKLQLLRGEFHRHTEYTAHRDQDGLLEDSWRYALDAGTLDWMGNGDHDNGHHDEYSWWQLQKTADLMHNPPHFVAVQSYERSVVYPNGHRNVIMPKRGIRPLPRGNLKGTEEKGTPDTQLLYRYLKHFGSMCSSHTSGTGMGTDWRDNDPVVEPVVEIYQGHRHNYEHFGAPRSPTKETQIGGYEPRGFIWNALDKGYKLGFQASSDHISTHMSYAIVLTDDVSRQGIIDAFKRRHSYAATDNIIVEFRCGKQIMGDIFDSAQAPKFDVHVQGTAPISKLSIVRSGKYVHVAKPMEREVKLTWTDDDPEAGKSHYYYVRIEQTDGNLAWASPMWVTYKGK